MCFLCTLDSVLDAGHSLFSSEWTVDSDCQHATDCADLPEFWVHSKPPRLDSGTISLVWISGSNLKFGPVQGLSSPGQTRLSNPMFGHYSPGAFQLCVKVLGLMVTNSFPYAQFHSRLLQLKFLAVWEQQAWSLDCPIHLTSRTRLALACYDQFYIVYAFSLLKHIPHLLRRIKLEGIPVKPDCSPSWTSSVFWQTLCGLFSGFNGLAD